MIDPNEVVGVRRALGRQLARYRQAAGLNQHQFAPHTHYGRSTVANVEIGRQNVPRGFWERADAVLGAGGKLLQSYDHLQALVARQRWEDAQLEAGQARLEAQRAGEWTVAFPGLSAAPFTHTVHEDTALAAMQAFRAADSQVGGGHLYPTVVRYLQTQIAPRLFSSAGRGDSEGLFTSAAALTEMAGWMAHDAGRDAVAAQHFGRARGLVGVGGPPRLHSWLAPAGRYSVTSTDRVSWWHAC